MRLVIQKSQKKGLMGGVSFEVKGRVDLAPEEKRLVDHYNLVTEILLQKPMVNIWGQPTEHMLAVTVQSLLAGTSLKCKSLADVIAFGNSLKEACNTLKGYLVAATTFEGDETHDF